MRKQLLTFCLLSLGLIYAQDSTVTSGEKDPNQSQNIFGDSKVTGGWGGLSIKGSHVDGKDALFMGAKGGVVFDNNLTLGLAGSWFFSPLTRYEKNDTLKFAGGYGGIFIEPSIWADKPVHFNVPIIIGAGGIAHNIVFNEDTDTENTVTTGSGYFVFEPGLVLELNMTNFMRLQFGGSYRFAYGMKLEDVDPKALNDWTAELCLKFGSF